MKSPLAQNTTNSAKNLAQQIARQIAQEPLEVFKTAGQQIAGGEQIANRQEVRPLDNKNPEVQKKTLQNQNELQDKAKSGRQVEAFQRELDDIRKQKLFKDLQYKISQGIEIPLADYPELSMEQKQVLNAQMEAVKFQKDQTAYTASQEGFNTPTSKKGRRFGQGQKEEAERQQTHVEKPVPPSG